MKRNYPYAGPSPQAQGAPQPAYGQPPPPAGPAPPLPSSGPPPPAAYANYGYGAVVPPRHAAAPMNAAGTNDAQQAQWNQQWQQQQQPPYYPHQQPGVAGAPTAGQYTVPRPPAQSHSASYRPMASSNAGSPAVNQTAAYSPHQTQQQSMPYSYPAHASPMQSQSPSQHHQPPGPSYGFNASVAQHQNSAPNSGGAQNWPGAYAPGSQVGPPNKKPRFQTSSAPVPSPTPSYVPPGAAPMAPMAGNLAGSASNQYTAQTQPPSQYPWQAPHAAPAPYMNPRPPAALGSGVYADTPGRGGLSAHPAKGDKGKRGAGNNTASASTGGRGMNRNGAQTRGNTPRAGLPVNPAASVNTIRAQNGTAPAWGAQTNAGQHRTSAGTGVGGFAQLGAGFQAGRRASASSSVHSDKKGRRADNPKVPGGGPAKTSGFSSQNMIPLNAPRGPNGARGKAGKTNPDESITTPQSLKSGAADPALTARGSDVASKNANATHLSGINAAVTDAPAAASAIAKDGGAGSKRAHTDFRILGLEIRELEWSWFAAQALAKDPVGADVVKDENPDLKPYLGQIKDDPSELLAVPAPASSTSDESKGEAVHHVEASQDAALDVEASQSKGDEIGSVEANELDSQGKDAKAEHASTVEASGGHEHEDHGGHPEEAEGEEDEDADGEEDTGVDADQEADDAAAAAAAGPRCQVVDEEDTTMPHVDADAATSTTQLSVAPTPEPEASVSLPKGPKSEIDQASALDGKAVKAERNRTVTNLRESTKLRFCFAAMFNAGPEGAPTGPKATQNQEQTANSETSTQDDKLVEQPEQKSTVDEQRSSESVKADELESKEKTDADDKDGKDPSGEAPKQAGSIAEPSGGSTAGDAVAEMAQRDASTLSKAPEASQHAVEGAPTKEQVQPAESDAAVPTETDSEVQKEEHTTQADEAENSEKDQQANDVATATAKAKKARSAGGDVVPHAKGPPQLSLNRIFLSFAANRKRLAIDAEAVHSVKIHRSEHWVEICIDVSPQESQSTRKKGEEYLVCNGTLLEKRAKGQENYTAVTRREIAAAWESGNADVKGPDTTEAADNEGSDDGYLELPPFSRLDANASRLTLFVHLDPSAPLPEPAWLRKNDVNSLLVNLQRGSSANAGRSETAISVAAAQHVWAGKIEVVDPDPPPCMSTFLYDWVKDSFIGGQKERRKFVDELLKGGNHKGNSEVKMEGEGGANAMEDVKLEGERERERDVSVARAFIEIVLRLVKGERAALSPATSTNADSGLRRALNSASFTTNTTYPGLVMLGLLNLALDNPASNPAVVRAQVDKLLMEIPHATLFKAVDLTWKDLIDLDRKSTIPPSPTSPTPPTAPGKLTSATRVIRQHNAQSQNRFHSHHNRHSKRKRT